MVYPQTTWRVLKTFAQRGEWNMAVDEAILEAVEEGKSPPTLRLYGWEPACLSIGYAQSYNDVDEERVAERGWDVVRRLTGGRAILHGDELTYAIIAPLDDPRLSGDITQSYGRLSKALLHGLRILGLKVEAESKGVNSNSNINEPICFEVPSNNEIVADGKKLIGSAQARRKKAVLQHGTLPLFGDLTRITDALRYESDERRNADGNKLLGRATTVEAVVGRRVEWEEAANAIAAGFEEALNITLEPGELSQKEVERAKELVSEKYGNIDWLKRR